MTNCKYITKNGRCGLKGSYAYQHGCFGEDSCRCREPMTNADRIRSMSDEEMAEFLTHINPTNCQDCAFFHGWCCQPDIDDYSDFKKCEEGRKRWLQQPAEGE